MPYFKGIDKKGVLPNEYSESAILHAPHFRRVVNAQRDRDVSKVIEMGQTQYTVLFTKF